MSLPGEALSTLDNRAYHNPTGLPIIDSHVSDQLNWLAAASPLASPTWSPDSYMQDQTSSASSVSAGMALDTMGCHQISCNSQSLNETAMHEPTSDTSFPSQLHLSPLEAPPAWTPAWQHASNLETYYASGIDRPHLIAHHAKAYTAPLNSESPASTMSVYGESPIQSFYYSSPDLGNGGFANLSPPGLLTEEMEYEEDDDGQGGKPYARLIYEALLEAPGHRMMLRDLYDWFEKNTAKPRESGTNGWQNSIRHNLSMNHAFENDKMQTVNARGEPKKATSVWYLTDHALRNGVQSTTRYRKNGGTRRSALHGRPNAVRARSGAKGGLAARRAARLRQKEQSPYLTWASPATAAPMDNMGPFNKLVQAAASLRDSTPTGSAIPGMAGEQQPYMPRSSASASLQAKISPEMGRHAKVATASIALDELKAQDLFLSVNLPSTLEDSWFQAGQIG